MQSAWHIILPSTLHKTNKILPNEVPTKNISQYLIGLLDGLIPAKSIKDILLKRALMLLHNMMPTCVDGSVNNK